MAECRILYVEDEENDVFLLKHAFKQGGIFDALQVVGDGQEAIDFLAGLGRFASRSEYPLPSLILLDLKMPHKSGFEVLEWIRQQPELSLIVVIVFTSSHDEGDVRRAYELGANSFIVKPPNVAELVAWVRVLKNWWLDYNQYATCEFLGGEMPPRDEVRRW